MNVVDTVRIKERACVEKGEEILDGVGRKVRQEDGEHLAVVALGRLGDEVADVRAAAGEDHLERTKQISFTRRGQKKTYKYCLIKKEHDVRKTNT